MTSATAEDQSRERLDKGRLIWSLLGVPMYFVLFMFLPAGTWDWVRGWIFIGVFLSVMTIAFWYLWRVNPEMIIARINTHQGTRRWDHILLWFIFPPLYAIVPVAALDDARFYWFPQPWWVCVIGYILLLIAIAIVTWAQAVNKFFEVMVRIQTERGHKVVDTGPYTIVRHPGYVGGVLLCLGAAMCLGSVWALIPAGVASALLILRTYWEDQMLQAELAGYKEYTQRVRYRLIPGVW